MRKIMGVLLLALGGCSAVQSVYVQRGYDAKIAGAIKRIAVVGWAPATQNGLAEVLSRVTGDLIKLRKNYLVRSTGTIKQNWAEPCDKLDGVLSVRALDAQSQEGGKIKLHLAAALYRCADGALVWESTGERAGKSSDNDLSNLTDVYHRDLGAAADTYAAPTFALMQQIIASLPDPVLNDDDVMEKIEIGGVKNYRVAALAP